MYGISKEIGISMWIFRNNWFYHRHSSFDIIVITRTDEKNNLEYGRCDECSIQIPNILKDYIRHYYPTKDDRINFFTITREKDEMVIRVE